MKKTSIGFLCAALILAVGALSACKKCDCDKDCGNQAPGGLKGIITKNTCAGTCTAGWDANHPSFNVNLATPTCVTADGKCHADLKAGFQCLQGKTFRCADNTEVTCDANGAWGICP